MISTSDYLVFYVVTLYIAIMNRTTVSRIELLNDLISEKETDLARIQSRACDPKSANLDRIGGKRCGNLREEQLIDYIDSAAGIQQSIDRLRLELDALHDEIISELESCPDYYTRKIVKWHLIHCYTWLECAELSGYCDKTCRDKYDKWLCTLH